ncbi:MAG TPA: hypothetical protein VI731_06735 [Bacteroidia bacterium]|nr:hypothetical protein [Bacteroidia bacterium]
MKRTTSYLESDVLKALKSMPSYVKEKTFRYKRKKKIAEKAFGKLVKQLEREQKLK